MWFGDPSLGIGLTLDTRMFASGSESNMVVFRRRARRRMQSTMKIAVNMMPPTVPLIAGPIMELVRYD
jgi:hypothetical protein